MAWDEVTAVGTLAVAAVTAGLAWTTRRLATAAIREARANWQPVLIPEISDDVHKKIVEAKALADNVLTIGVRNVGRGPALTTTVALWLDDDEPQLVDKIYRGKAAADVVPPDERLAFRFTEFNAPEPPKDLGAQAWST